MLVSVESVWTEGHGPGAGVPVANAQVPLLTSVLLLMALLLLLLSSLTWLWG